MILTAKSLGQPLLVVSHCVIVHCASINSLIFFLHMKLCPMYPNSKTLRWWKINSKFVWHHVVQFGLMKWNLMMMMFQFSLVFISRDNGNKDDNNIQQREISNQYDQFFRIWIYHRYFGIGRWEGNYIVWVPCI